MKLNDDSGSVLPQISPKRETSTSRTRRKKPVPALPIRITSGEVLLYSPPNITTRNRPCISLGRFRDGTWALHFRQYALDEKSAGGVRITRDGASFTIAEVELGINKAKAMAALVPDAPTVRGRPDGGSI